MLIHEINGCEIRCGDGPKRLGELTEPVKFILTDPPYNILKNPDLAKPKNIKTGNEGHITRYQEWDDLEDSEYFSLVGCLFESAAKVLDGWAIVFMADRYLSDGIRLAERAGLKFHLPYWWGKSNPPPRIRVQQPKAATEMAVMAASHGDVDASFLFSKGSPEHNIKGGVNYVIGPFQHASQRLHRTQKPNWLLQHLITEFTKPGDLVCDPFAGSFSTLQACLITARRCIAWEIDERRCEVAAMVHTHGFERARQKAIEYGFTGNINAEEKSQLTIDI